MKSRRQGSNEPVCTYYYAIIDLCRQYDREQDTTMSESRKVDYLLRGLIPSLRSRVWPLVPYPIDSTEKFLEIVSKHSEADDMDSYCPEYESETAQHSSLPTRAVKIETK